jgi:hypothetical protein
MISATLTFSFSPASDFRPCDEEGASLRAVLSDSQSANWSSLGWASYLSRAESPASSADDGSSTEDPFSLQLNPEADLEGDGEVAEFNFKPLNRFSLFSHIWTREEAPRIEVSVELFDGAAESSLLELEALDETRDGEFNSGKSSASCFSMVETTSRACWAAHRSRIRDCLRRLLVSPLATQESTLLFW